MQALFEVLSLEGWLEVRDVIIDRVDPVSVFRQNCVFRSGEGKREGEGREEGREGGVFV